MHGQQNVKSWRSVWDINVYTFKDQYFCETLLVKENVTIAITLFTFSIFFCLQMLLA